MDAYNKALGVPMMSEFDLIARYFTRPTKRARVGIGDDCAVIAPTPGMEMAISTDTLVSGVHFFADADAEHLGHKALAVNLSDLAACGALPRFATLALTLPSVDAEWLRNFSLGFFALADEHDIELIGGDTTKGPLSITITVMGEIEPGRAIRRNGANAGDAIWVSGELGEAALALMRLTVDRTKPHRLPNVSEAGLRRLTRPTPRVELGRALVGVASAAIDLSDGLLADLGHIAENSMLGATIARSHIPVPRAFSSLSSELFAAAVLAGGDDYELCFTAPPEAHEQIETISETLDVKLTCIGHVHARRAGVPLVMVQNALGEDVTPTRTGFDHFG